MSTPTPDPNPLHRWRAFLLSLVEMTLLAVGFGALALTRSLDIVSAFSYSINLALGLLFVAILKIWLTLLAGRVLFRSDVAALLGAALIGAYAAAGNELVTLGELHVGVPILVLVLGTGIAFFQWSRQQPELNRVRVWTLTVGLFFFWLIMGVWITRELLSTPINLPVTLHTPGLLLEWFALLLAGRSLAAWLAEGGVYSRWSSFLLLLGAGPSLPVMYLLAHLLFALKERLRSIGNGWLLRGLYILSTLTGMWLFYVHQHIWGYVYAFLFLLCAVVVLVIRKRLLRVVAGSLLALGFAVLMEIIR